VTIINKTISSFKGFVLLFIVIALAVFGFHYAKYNGIIMQFMSGAFTNFEDYPIYGYMMNQVTFRAYIWLGAHFSGIVWPTYIITACLFASLAVFIKLLRVNSLTNGWRGAALAFILVFFILRDISLLFDVVGYATAICALTILTSFFINNHTPKRYLAITLMLFTLSLLTRIEAALPMLLLGTALHLFTLKQPLSTFRKFLPHILIACCIALALNLDFKYSNDYYKRLEPWAEPKLTHGNDLVPLSNMHNEKDSMRYIAATNLIYDDTVQLHENFIRSIVTEQHLLPKSANGITGILQVAWYNLATEWKNISYSYNIAIAALILLCLYLSYIHKKTLACLLYIICVPAGLLVISLVSMEDVYIMYICNMAILILVFYLISLNADKIKLLTYNGILTVVLAACVINCIQSAPKYAAITANNKKQKTFHEELELKHKNQIIVFDLNNIYVNNYSPLKLIDYKNFKAVYFHDAVHEMHMNNLRAYFEKECNCNPYNWSSVYSFFYSHKNEAVFISSPSRIQLKEAYLQKVYSEPYYFEKVTPTIFFYAPSGDTLFCYRLERDSATTTNNR